MSENLGRQSQRSDAGAVASIGRITEEFVYRLIARAFGVRTQPRNPTNPTGGAQCFVVDFGARRRRAGAGQAEYREGRAWSRLEWSTSMVHTVVRRPPRPKKNALQTKGF
jgi:hypothetical protein